MKYNLPSMKYNPPPIELKPCPFCGSTDLFVERATYSACYVQCDGCGAHGPTEDQESDDEGTPGEKSAREAWNKRAV